MAFSKCFFLAALLANLATASVNCGGHIASSCGKCPTEENTKTFCNGDCQWKYDRCVKKNTTLKAEFTTNVAQEGELKILLGNNSGMQRKESAELTLEFNVPEANFRLPDPAYHHHEWGFQSGASQSSNDVVGASAIVYEFKMFTTSGNEWPHALIFRNIPTDKLGAFTDGLEIKMTLKEDKIIAEKTTKLKVGEDTKEDEGKVYKCQGFADLPGGQRVLEDGTPAEKRQFCEDEGFFWKTKVSDKNYPGCGTCSCCRLTAVVQNNEWAVVQNKESAVLQNKESAASKLASLVSFLVVVL